MKKFLEIVLILILISSYGSISMANNTTIYSNISDSKYQERLQRARQLRNSVGFVTSSNMENENNVNNSLATNNYTSNYNEEEPVYVTPKGSHFHMSSCSLLNNASKIHKIMLKTAIKDGYVPCKICNPYGLAGTDNQNSKDKFELDNWVVLLLNLILAITLYMGVPLYLKYKKINFNSKKELLQFVIAYGIIIYALYFLIYLINQEPKLPNLIYPFLFGIINYKTLKKLIKISNTN